MTIYLKKDKMVAEISSDQTEIYNDLINNGFSHMSQDEINNYLLLKKKREEYKSTH